MWGIVYKITDLDSGHFYIGLTTRQLDWEKQRYWGGGKAWIAHRKKYPQHNYRREILADNFESYKELQESEIRYIKQNIDNPLCLNKTDRKQNEFDFKVPVPCPECGGTYGWHDENCSLDNTKKCPECGGKHGHHKKGCKKLKICPKCGVGYGPHKKSCPYYKSPVPCPECGEHNGKHKDNCTFKHKWHGKPWESDFE